MTQYALNMLIIAVASGIVAVLIKSAADRRYKNGRAQVLGFFNERGDERASVRIFDEAGTEVGVFAAFTRDVRGHEDGTAFNALYATFPKNAFLKISCRIKPPIESRQKEKIFFPKSGRVAV